MSPSVGSIHFYVTLTLRIFISDLIETVEEALTVLTIPDKQVLIDSKLLQSLQKWENENILVKDEVKEVEKALEEKNNDISETLTEQKDVVVKHAEDQKNEIDPVVKKGHDTNSENANQSSDDGEKKQQQKESIRAKAKRILETWSHLQETKFKIPKSARAAQRALHEQEMDKQLATKRPSPPVSEISYPEAGQKIEAFYQRYMRNEYLLTVIQI